MTTARTIYAEYVSYASRNLNGCTPMTFEDFCEAHDLATDGTIAEDIGDVCHRANPIHY